MQSMWTGLAECSFAWPVSLSASLPACGWFSVLHSGLSTEAVAAAFLAGDLVVFWAKAGVTANAAIARALMKWERIMVDSSWKGFIWDSCRRASLDERARAMTRFVVAPRRPPGCRA